MFRIGLHGSATRVLLGRLVGPNDTVQWVVLVQDDSGAPIEFLVVAHGGRVDSATSAVEDGLLVAGYAHERAAVPGAWTRAWRITV